MLHLATGARVGLLAPEARRRRRRRRGRARLALAASEELGRLRRELVRGVGSRDNLL